MSPTKFHDLDPRRSSDHINGPRPSPLKLNKDSHTIHKPSSSSTSVSGSAQPPRNGPIIIYTHSPKVIHTQARDFMALVQKLTGLSPRNSDQEDHKPPPPPPQQAKTTKPSEGGVDVGSLKSVSPLMKPPANPFLADIPLFTPTSTEHFFCSPRAMYRFSETTTTNVAANCNNPISPSFLEFMKGLPEY